MFFDHTAADLKSGLDKISVPVFAIDLEDDGGFRIAALNAAHTNVTGIDNDAARGRTVFDILSSADEARGVVARYESAIARKDEISYRETLTFGDRELTFDTSLHPVTRKGEEAPSRLIGTAVRVASDVENTQELQWLLEQSEAALLAIADVLRFSRGGVGDCPHQRAAVKVMIRNAQEALDQLRQYTGGTMHMGWLLNKSDLPPETKQMLQ